MKTKKIITTVAVALTLGAVYTGCKKDKESEATPSASNPTTTTTTTSNNTPESQNAVAENSMSDIFKSVSEVAHGTSGLRSACYTVTIDSTPFFSWPKTVTIDFGNGTNCNGKKGKIKAILTGSFDSAGTIITITTDSNYFSGGCKINGGMQIITNNGNNSFSTSVVGGVVWNSGSQISWNCNRTITMIAGDTTLTPADDVYKIEGSSTFTDSKGNTYSATITTPLIKANNCPWIEEGVLEFVGKNSKKHIIDYGNTGCDNQATITNDSGKVYNITI